jgi:hypothetical protein
MAFWTRRGPGADRRHRVAHRPSAQRRAQGEGYVSLQPAGRAPVFTHVVSVDHAPSIAAPASAGDDEALEFVRFCYRRRRVGWPALYDEMSAVASRGAFRGLGYCELAERGISFCLPDLPRLVALTDRVVREEQPIAEPPPAQISLSMAPARS